MRYIEQLTVNGKDYTLIEYRDVLDLVREQCGDKVVELIEEEKESRLEDLREQMESLACHITDLEWQMSRLKKKKVLPLRRNKK